MSDPQVTLEGLYTADATLSGYETDLYLSEESNTSADTDVNQEDIPTQDDDEALLAALSGSRDFLYSGTANGIRLLEDNFGSNIRPNDPDPVSALKEYLIQIESLVLPEQGSGYALVDNVAGVDITPDGELGVLVSNASWEYTDGDGVKAEWNVEAQLGEGLQGIDELRIEYFQGEIESIQSFDETVLSAESGPSLNMGYAETRRYERDIDINVTEIIHDFDLPVVGVIETGVKGTFNISGKVSDRDTSRTLPEWANTLNTEMHGTEVTLQDEFTGREFSGAVGSTNADVKAGTPNIVEYRVEIAIGQEQTG